jgi:sugar lactone lactonase YvrE
VTVEATEVIDAELVLDARCALAEGPVWDDRHGVLRWVDIDGHAIHRLDPTTGDHRIVPVGQTVGALALRRGDGLVLATATGFVALDEATGRTTLLAPVEHDDPTTRMNDGACDARGRFWAGTMALDLAPGRGSLYCFEPDGTVRRELAGVTLSNGIEWDTDGRTMLYIDSRSQRVDTIEYDLDSGRLGTRRPLIPIAVDDGLPDGMAMDAEGGLWVCLWGAGRVQRFGPDGTPDVAVVVPATQTTSCAFGGPDLATLYVTTAREGFTPADAEEQSLAGGIFAARVAVPGLLPHRFGA